MIDLGRLKIIIFFFIVFLPFFKIKAQNYENQGEGKVVVEKIISHEQYSKDITIMPQTFTFYIKNLMILREEPAIIESPQEQLNLNSLGYSKPIYNHNGNLGGTVTNNMNVSFRKIKYLLDLKSQKAFIFGDKNDKNYYYVEDLKDYSIDLYRLFFELSKKNDITIDKLKFTQNKMIIAGNICEEGFVYLNQKKDSKANLWFIRNKISLKTPLDNLFRNTMPYSILYGIFPIGKEGIPEGYLSILVKEIKEQKIPDEKFEIPADAILLTKTEWENYHFGF